MRREPRTESLTVPPEADGRRLDRFVADRLTDCSRSAVQRLIKDGHVRLHGGAEVKPSTQVRAGDRVEIDHPEPIPVEPPPQAMDLNVVYEDDALIVINKPVGLVVHPAPGNRDRTLVNALLHHCTRLSTIGGVERPGIVHRLDKLTSGLMVVAKCDRAHRGLVSQLSARRMKRTYVAVVWGDPQPPEGSVTASIGRHHRDRTRMTAVVAGGRRAATHYRTRASAHGLAVIDVSLETGRTHQIRVHLAHAGYPVVGDEQYGLRGKGLSTRLGELPPALRTVVAGATHQYLHARRLQFEHPLTSEPMDFEAPPPGDVERLILAIERLGG